MTDTHLYIIFGLIAVFPILQIALKRFMQPIRLEFADLGSEILETEGITEEQEYIINMLLDDAYNWKNAIFLALFTLPVGLYVIISKAIGADREFRMSPFQQVEQLPLGNKFLDRYMLCMLGSNPIAAILAMMQFIPVMAVLSALFWSFDRSKQALESQVVGYVATAKRI